MNFDRNSKIEPFYQKIDLGDGLYKIMGNGFNWGIYDQNIDEIIIPCKYSDIFYYKPFDVFITPTSVIDRENKVIIPEKYDMISILEHKYIEISNFKEKGTGVLSGIIDLNGKILVQPKYVHIWPGENGFLVSDGDEKNEKCGYVGRDGYANLEYTVCKRVYFSEYDSSTISCTLDCSSNEPYIESFSCKPKMLIVSKNGKQGVIDLDNRIVIPFVYDNIDFCEDESIKPSYFIVQKGLLFGLLDVNGNVLFPLNYKRIEPHFEHEEEYEELNDQYDDLEMILNENSDMFFVDANDLEEDDMYGDSVYDKEIQEIHRYDEFRKGKRVYFEIELLDGQKKNLLPNGEAFVPRPYQKAKDQRKFSISVPFFPWDSESDILEREREYLEKQKETTSFDSKRAPSKDSTCNFTNKIEPSLFKTPTIYLFFDTETTGLPIDYKAPSSNVNNWPRLIQLSWVIADENCNVISTNDHIIYPNGFTIPNDVAILHGITNLKAKQLGEPIEKVLEGFLSDFNRATCIVGHNVAFDKKIIGAELIRLGMEDVMNSKPSICTMEASTDYCKIPDVYGYKWPKLQELHAILFGYEFNDAHNSMCDVKATLNCFKELKRIGVVD